MSIHACVEKSGKMDIRSVCESKDLKESFQFDFRSFGGSSILYSMWALLL